MQAVGGVLDGPGEGALERHNQVDQGPTDDDVVVCDDAEGGEDGCETNTRQTGVDSSEYTDITALEFLAEHELHEGYGDADCE